VFDALKGTELTALILRDASRLATEAGAAVEFLHVFVGHASHALEETQNKLLSWVSLHLLVHDCPALIAYLSAMKANYARDL